MQALLLLFALVACLASKLHHAPCPRDAIQDGLMQVQCNRDPPCIRWSYLNPTKCKDLLLDESWPTYDPYIRRQHSWHTMRELLSEHAVGKNIILVGDSITTLFYHGFSCEASRHQLTLNKESSGRLRAYLDSIPPNEVAGTFFVQETDTIISHCGWARFVPDEFERYLLAADIVIVNFGLHYHDMKLYKEDMNKMFILLGDFNKIAGKLAIYRETPAQSFAKTSAFAGETSQCAPLGNDLIFNNFVYRQNEVTARLAAQYNIPILHFYNLTVPRWNFREGAFCTENGKHPDCNDCTHLCASPTMYAKIVNDLYKLFTYATLR